MINDENFLLHWIPYKLVIVDNELLFEWIFLDTTKFIDPFFEDTIRKCKSHPYNSTRYKIISSAKCLIEWSKLINSSPLSGLIFHISRCGSTLLSQLLAIANSNIVISESPVIDQVLRSEKINPATKELLSIAIFNFLGQKRFPEEGNLLIKLDSWHVFHATVLRSIFSETPFIFLIRNPDEVLKSHLNLPGMHMVPGVLPAEVFGLNKNEVKNMSILQYPEKVLQKIFENIISFKFCDSNSWLLNYNDGMHEVLKKASSIFKVRYSETEMEKIQERMSRHSKQTDKVFEGDKNPEIAIDSSDNIKLYNQLIKNS